MAHLLIIEGWISESGNLIIDRIKKMGHTFTFVTGNPELYKVGKNSEIHPLFKEAINVIKADTNNIKKLIENLKECKFDGVLTVCDYYFEIVQQVAKEFDVPCALPKKVDFFRNKYKMREAIEKSKMVNVKYAYAKTWEEAIKSSNKIGYPLVVKPADLAASAFVSLIQNEEELKEIYDKLEGFAVNFRGQRREKGILIEEFLDGEEISVESISIDGEISILGITDKTVTGKPYFIETGHMFPAALNEEQKTEIKEYVKEVLSALNFNNGIAHTEVKLTSNGPRIVEINPRTPGNHIVELIEAVTHINLLDVYIELSLAKKIKLNIQTTSAISAAIAFLVPEKGGEIHKIDGTEKLKENPNIIKYQIDNAIGKKISKPIDNDCYLGYVMSIDYDGYKSREYAEEAINNIKIVYK